METRKVFYKATKQMPSLSERVKKDRVRQNLTRKDKFNANRQIDLIDSPATMPTKPAHQPKLSEIRDKSTRLRTYIEQKRTAKLKEKIEERAPFIPYVPVGRWVPKAEPLQKSKPFIMSTPVRKALMSDGKILKKSTIKQIALATTTAKKENAGTLKKDLKKQEVKSKRKILTDANSSSTEDVPSAAPIALQRSKVTFAESKEKATVIQEEQTHSEHIPSLNETFELITDDLTQEDSVFEPSEKKNDEKTQKPVIEIQSPSPPSSSHVNNIPEEKKKTVAVEKEIIVTEKKQQAPRAKIVVPVKPQQQQKKPVELKRKVPPQKSASEKIVKKQESKKKKSSPKAKSPEKVTEELLEPKQPSPVPIKKSYSHTYQFYKSSLKNQVAYINIQMKDINEDVENFVANMSEETQTLIHQTVQQSTLLVNDKFKAFEDVLEKFEEADPNDPKRITEDDIENYWHLLYDQIEKFKENLAHIREEKNNENKKRRATRVHTLVDTTPSRRSRRIAERVDTPTHGASCYGCTPLSSSKINTPKSAKSLQKRRTAFKKSIAFDQP